MLARTSIPGVHMIAPRVASDARGEFFELFRASWLEADGPRWCQWNVSQSRAGVVRGLHVHRLQSEVWHVPVGVLLVALVDLRPASPTRGASLCFVMGERPLGLVVPAGVLHGYRALGDTTVLYLMDREYDGTDEYAVRWDDRTLGLSREWYDRPAPILSARDAAAPPLAEAMRGLGW